MATYESSALFHQAVEAAKHDQAVECGPYYKSALEGYGDVSRMLLSLQEDMKALKKNVAALTDWVGGADADQLVRSLQNAANTANVLAYQGVGMCAMISRYIDTINASTGGDLLDMLEEDEDE